MYRVPTHDPVQAPENLGRCPPQLRRPRGAVDLNVEHPVTHGTGTGVRCHCGTDQVFPVLRDDGQHRRRRRAEPGKDTVECPSQRSGRRTVLAGVWKGENRHAELLLRLIDVRLTGSGDLGTVRPVAVAGRQHRRDARERAEATEERGVVDGGAGARQRARSG